MSDDSTIVLAKSVGNDELHQIRKSALLHHTLIVGQSGSGKSYFLSRLIEEILLRTGARAVLVDPNGDYRKFGLPSVEVWTDFSEKFGLFSSESEKVGVADFDKKENFVTAWSQINHLALHAGVDASSPANPSGLARNERLQIDWSELEQEDQIGALADLALSAQGMHLFQSMLRRLDPSQTNIETIISVIEAVNSNVSNIDSVGPNLDQRIMLEVAHADQNDRKELVYKLRNYQRQHSSILLHSAGLHGDTSAVSTLHRNLAAPFDQNIASTSDVWRDLALVLDRVEQPSMLQVVDATLAKLWREARVAALLSSSTADSFHRVPTFVVIDEAQNFIPKEPRGELQQKVAERVYQIASEGRKYGLYLILVSQRPSKLHTGVVPECENSAILRLQSPEEIEVARQKLGTDMVLSGSLPRFRQGRAVINGQWSQTAQDVTVAPARTVLGGSGLGNGWLSSPIELA